MPKCAATDCRNQPKKGSGRSFHLFPHSKPELLKQWKRNMHRENLIPSKSCVLCSDHFEAKCFDRTGQTVRLRDGAVPTIFTFPKYPTKAGQKQKSEVNQSPSSKKFEEDLSRKEEIDEFLKLHGANLGGANVKKIRRVLPLLRKEVCKYGPSVKKAKGTWDKNSGVQDPNNGDATTPKPRKEQLLQTLKDHVAKYKEQNNFSIVQGCCQAQGNSSLSPRSYGPPSEQMSGYTLSIHGGTIHSLEQQNEPSSSFDDLPAFELSENSGNGAAFENPLDQLEQIKLSEEVMDNIDSDMIDYDPVSELIRRIEKKIDIVRKENIMKIAYFQSMKAHFIDIQMKALTPDNSITVIGDLHYLETNIDMLLASYKVASGRVSSEIPSDGSSAVLTETGLSESQKETVCQETAPSSLEELVGDCNIINRFGAPQLAENVKHVSFRGVVAQPSPEAQNVNFATTALSEGHKPVQAPEDKAPKVAKASECGSQLLKEINFYTPEEELYRVENVSLSEVSLANVELGKNDNHEFSFESLSRFGSPYVPQSTMCSIPDGRNVESRNAAILYPLEGATDFSVYPNFPSPTLMWQGIYTQNSVPASWPATTQQQPFYAQLQPQTTNIGKKIRPGRKRCYPSEDDSMMDSLSIPETSLNSMDVGETSDLQAIPCSEASWNPMDVGETSDPQAMPGSDILENALKLSGIIQNQDVLMTGI